MRFSRLISTPSYWIFWLVWNLFVKHVILGCMNAYADSAEKDWQRVCEEISSEEDPFKDSKNASEGMQGFRNRMGVK